MAATYQYSATDILFSPNKAMISMFNSSGSGKTVKLYRAWMLNNQVTAVTGIFTTLEFRRITSQSGGTTLTGYKRDSNSAAIPAQIVGATNATVGLGGLFRRWVWSTDEPIQGTSITIDELECIYPLNMVWSLGYGDSSQTIELAEGEGIAIMNTGGISGQCDLFFEFTLV